MQVSLHCLATEDGTNMSRNVILVTNYKPTAGNIPEVRRTKPIGEVEFS
jgi:hypothetical protein